VPTPTYQCVRRVVTLVIAVQTMSFRYHLACKGHSTEKEQDLVTWQNDLCCFGLTFTLS